MNIYIIYALSFLITAGIIIGLVMYFTPEKFQDIPNQPQQEFEAHLNAEEQDPLFKSNQLIGLMYPPRCGPLQTNYEFPEKTGGSPTPFVAIYKQEPYLRYFGYSCDQ
jgi:hypothetical protein